MLSSSIPILFRYKYYLLMPSWIKSSPSLLWSGITLALSQWHTLFTQTHAFWEEGFLGGSLEFNSVQKCWGSPPLMGHKLTWGGLPAAQYAIYKGDKVTETGTRCAWLGNNCAAADHRQLVDHRWICRGRKEKRIFIPLLDGCDKTKRIKLSRHLFWVSCSARGHYDSYCDPVPCLSVAAACWLAG